MNSATEELLSYLRTIANFGGTLEQAKALAAKAVDSIAVCTKTPIDISNDQYLPKLPAGFGQDSAGGPWSHSQVMDYGRLCWLKGREHGRLDTVKVQANEKSYLSDWSGIIKNLPMDRSL